MVDLPRLTLSEGVSVTAHNLEITGLQGGSEASQSGKFNKLFKQSINKGATPESGISTPEHGAVLPNNAGQLITLESKSLRGGMSLLVGGDEPTNDVIKEFAQSQGVNAELIALLMKEPSSVSQTKPTSINSAQQVSLLSNKAPLSEEKIPRAMDILSGSVKDTTNQNTLHTAIPSKFIVSESALSKSTVTQTQTVQNSTLPLNLESARLGGIDDDGILIQTKNAEPSALVDATGKRTLAHTLDRESLLSEEKIPRAMDILSGSVKDTTNQNTLHTAIPSKFIVSESALSKSTVTQTQTVQNSTLPLNLESARLGGVDDDGILIQTKNAEPSALVDATGKRTLAHTLDRESLLSEEKIPRAMDILSGSVKDTTNQNTLHTAIPSKFIVSESALSKSTVTQTQTVQNSTLPLNLESARLGGVDDDGILIQTKNAEPLALVDATGKRTSVERPDEVLMIKQEQHADMSKRLAEALGQRLTAQISKGVWQVELDIHPKSLGRIEIHLEMKGGELEAHFNASRALTRELLQDGMPRLKEELREHGIETAYLGLGSGKQGTSGGNSTPSGNRNNGEDEDMTVNHAKAAMLEPKGGAVKKLTLIDGLDITI